MCKCNDYREFDEEFGGIVVGEVKGKDNKELRMYLRDLICFSFCPFCGQKIEIER